MTAVATLISGRPGSMRYALRAREEQSLVAPARAQRNARGTRVVMPTFGEKYRIRLSNDGENVHLPPIADLDVGDRVTLISSIWWHDVVHPDVASMYTPKRQVAVLQGRTLATVMSEDRQFRIDRFTTRTALLIVSSRMQDAGRQPEPLHVFYRPSFDCLITDLSRSGSSTGRDQGWTIDLEEERAP